ncbi:F-box protein [Aspergillus lucknowensis]|uniref:F-box domain-containing protein n=1 Tax=Aspergillus lucknowensis TaxID=176173 RepID=A0ABR4LNG0_9EURO
MLHPSFYTLPIELQCAVIRYLDPIALISISQTSRHLRALVSPTKAHFAERLLALECLETPGGPPIHFSRRGILNPDRNSPEWEANRWACTDCLRLLPYHAFTNQSLSQLRYRKPIRDSPASEKCTTWEPTHSTSRTGGPPKRKTGGKQPISEEERLLRKRYAITTTQNWGLLRTQEVPNSQSHTEFQCLGDRLRQFQGAGMREFESMHEIRFMRLTDDCESAIFDREAHAIELVRAGSRRHIRRCIECRFRRGEFRGCTGAGRRGGIGTPRVPIVVGRQRLFGTVVDRYFPGFSQVMDNKRPPFNAPVFVIYRDDARERPWTLYRVRCPGCARWQELRAFRFGGMDPRWEPRDNSDRGVHDQYHNWDGEFVTDGMLDGLRCHQCFVQQHGREALGKMLVEWLGELINAQLAEYAGDLRSGFNHLSWRLKFASTESRENTERLLRDVRAMLDKDHLALTRTDLALLRQRRGQWLDLYPSLRDGDDDPGNGLWFYPDRWFLDWARYYDESEALWLWLKGLQEEIQEDGKAGVLVDWVLSRDETVNS